jgi:hypothetical protein
MVVRTELESKDDERVVNILTTAVNQARTPSNIDGWYRHAMLATKSISVF